MSNTTLRYRPIKAYLEDSICHGTEILDDEWADEDNFVSYKPRKALYEEYGWNTQD